MNEREDELLPPRGEAPSRLAGAEEAGRRASGDGAGEPAAGDPIARLLQLAGARPPVPADRMRRVEAAVYEAWAEARRRRRRQRLAMWGGAAALAAGLALAVGIGWRAGWGGEAGPALATVERVAGAPELLAGDRSGADRSLAVGARLRPGDAVATGRSGRVALRLDSGSSLRLDVGTRLTLLAADRVVLRAGAVYLDSQGGPPVTVETPWGEVEERGTQFEVRLAGQAVRVRVREGAVSLDGGASSWDAAAGTELVLTAAGRLSRGSVPPHGEVWQWVVEIAPPFELEGQTLADFLAWVGRETGWQVRWRDPRVAAGKLDVVLHGPLDGLTPEQALAAVVPTCGLAHQLDGGTVLLFANDSH